MARSPAPAETWERRHGAALAPLARYRRCEPEKTLLHAVVRDRLEPFLAAARGRSPSGHGLPAHVERDLRAYLDCGILCRGFARIRCAGCGFERLVAFSCKARSCPSCNARRMEDAADHLVHDVFPAVPVRLPGPVEATEEPGLEADAEGSVQELVDDLPAFDFYRDRLREHGVELTRENFYRHAVEFPLGIELDGGELLVRMPVALEEDGAIRCGGPVPERAVLVVCQAPPPRVGGRPARAPRGDPRHGGRRPHAGRDRLGRARPRAAPPQRGAGLRGVGGDLSLAARAPATSNGGSREEPAVQ